MENLGIKLLLLSACFAVSAALICYECTGDIGRACSKGDSSDLNTQECASTVAMCLSYIANGDTVWRGCSNIQSGFDGICDIAEMQFGASKCSICSEDKCNGEQLE